MSGIEKELVVFLVAVLSGASVRLAYRCLGCFREIVRHSIVMLNIEDMVFWLCVAFYLFRQIYQTNNGSIRWHFVLGVVLGAIFMSIVVRRCGKILENFLSEKC